MKRYTFETNALNWYGTSSLISAFSAAGKMAVAVAQDRCFAVTQFTLKTGSVLLRLSACKSSLKTSWKTTTFYSVLLPERERESVHSCVHACACVCWIFVFSNTDNKDLTQHIYYMFREFVRQGVQRTHCQGYAGRSALVRPWNLILKHKLQTPARADKEQSSVRSSTHCHEKYLLPRH